MSLANRNEPSFEHYIPPHFTGEEMFFDEMMAKGQIQQASEFISAYAKNLREKHEGGRYAGELFQANLKELALPMYRKLFADTTGFQYDASCTEIPAMYQRATEMMSDLLAIKYNLPSAPQHVETQEEYNRVRGELTSLTAFALATRSMKGTGDDITIVPSSALHDAGKRLRRLEPRTGYDYKVFDRNREDESYELQIKTSQLQNHVYAPTIGVLYMEEFLSPLNISLEKIQLMIAQDGDHHDFTVHRAARRMQRVLSNALDVTAEAS